jgi:hypothetical protein
MYLWNVGGHLAMRGTKSAPAKAKKMAAKSASVRRIAVAV